MPEKTFQNFSVKYLQILDESGSLDKKLMPRVARSQIKKFYETMVLARVFDEKALALQRQGRLGTYAPGIGQEACQVGSISALKKSDWIFPAFRESTALIARGMPLDMIFQYWAGDERGEKTPNNIFTVSIPVGTHLPHAVGVAWAAKMKKQKTISLVYFGDGATSKGDFHESMNFAGTFKIPVIFLCQNNQYAISMPVEKQTAAKTLAQKAIAYGFEGIKVDGNDVFAVYKATKEAAEKARIGGGPTLIECFTYRIGDHTTADDATRYRSNKEVAYWKKKDPIDRLKKYMQKQKLWTSQYEKKVLAHAKNLVEKAVTKEEAISKPNPEDIFAYVYKEQTKQLKEQMDYLKNAVRE